MDYIFVCDIVSFRALCKILGGRFCQGVSAWQSSKLSIRARCQGEDAVIYILLP